MQQTAVSTMKALVFDRYGQPESGSIRDVAVPKLKDGSLLVRMRAAAVNPFDYKLVTGAMKDWIHTDFPFVPGMDGAGEIVDVGSGVQAWRKGDAVLAQFPRGTFAQYALISANNTKLARKPEALDFPHAAAIPESALTAKTMLRAGEVRANQNVLIVGATGGVGSYLTQLASAAGAWVMATGKSADAHMLRELGADEVVDYGAGDTIGQVQERFPDGVDVVFDLVSMGEKLLRDADALREGGILVSSLGGPDESAFANSIKVRYIQLKAEEGDLVDLAGQAADGTLRVEIAQVYDLDHAAQALTDLMDPAKHTRGKLVIHIP